MLEDTQGARRYVTLFEAPFVASELEGRENHALRAGSLMAILPPPPGSQPLPGAPLVDLTGQNLAQWADRVQEVTSHMRSSPLGVTECPTLDIVSVLNRLEGMTRVPYCRHCFGVRQWCQCSVIPHQAPDPTMALWTPPITSYAAMVSSTETTASNSTVGMTLSRPLTPGLPPLELMDMSHYPTTEELLRMAGVSRGARGWTPLQTPTAPGPHQPGPRTPHPQVPTPGRQEATAPTPYWQQVFPPPTPAPRQDATSSASQSQEQERPADEETRPQGRSSSRGPRDRQRAPRSSTRGSRKHCRRAQDDDLVDEMMNFVASGWKQDLIHFIGCCSAAQVGPLEGKGWWVAIQKFISVMVKWKKEWTDVKELTPLKYMSYVAKCFCEVTGKDLQGLDQFAGWIGRGGYYHWRVLQQGLIHLVPHL